jgi:signal transduction histidine kinase
MMAGVRGALRSYYFQILAAALIVATILLMWFGYRATSEWQRSTRQVVDRRTIEVLYLMVTALTRDMRAVQSQVLPQLGPLDNYSGAYEVADEAARAFARFPYPDSFFSWKAEGENKGVLRVFNRADRPPAWYKGKVGIAEFPTTLLKDPPELADMLDLLRKQAALRTRAILFETTIQGEPYQVIARPVYVPPSRTTLQGVVGFTVNINWVRAHYFSELTAELSRVVEGRSSMALEIFDENGTLVTSNRPAGSVQPAPETSVRERKFPLLFFDPVLRATVPKESLPVRYWIARAQAVPDESILAAASGASRTFMLISVAAAAAVIALLLTVRAARSAAVLATMKSEFVSAVTHELKTPLSSIRLVSETLARGRFRAPEKVAEYATLLLNEVSRLTRTVDNLLTISRVQDIERFYTFEAVDPGTLLEDALNSFNPQLKEQGFEVNVDIPAPLPLVYADRTAILQVLENVLDNAIRYSNGTRHLSISASASTTEVTLRIADKGRGIPPDEAPYVFEKFFRGHNVTSGGSGLGLAIAQRIMKDHHGQVRLESAPGIGTVAEILLPIDKREAYP